MSSSDDQPGHHQPERRRRRTRAVYTLAGSPVACRAYSMISRPMPPRRPVEISATTTPTTDGRGGQLQRRHHVRHGGREPQLEQRLPPRGGVAVHQLERRRPTPTASPRSVPTATGKKARNAPSTATDSHRGHSQPTELRACRPSSRRAGRARSAAPSATRPGTAAGRARRPEPGITTASAMPTTPPSDEADERRAGTSTSVAASTTCQIGVSAAAALGLERAAGPSSHMCGIARSLVARAGSPAEDLAAVLRPERLVELPQRGDAGPARRRTADVRQTRRTQCTRRAVDLRRHDLASACSASAGMTCSPYGLRACASLPSCCR